MFIWKVVLDEVFGMVSCLAVWISNLLIHVLLLLNPFLYRFTYLGTQFDLVLRKSSNNSKQ